MANYLPTPPDRQPAASFFIAFAFLLLLTVTSLHAGNYAQNFAFGTVGTQTIGGGDLSALSSSASTITTKISPWAQGGNKALQLMGTLGGNTASWKMPDLDAGKEIQSFDATFNAGTYRQTAGAIPGAGWSLNFGAIPSGNGAGEGGFVMPSGIVIAWDIFNNGGTDNPSVEVFCGGVSVGNFPSATLTDSPVPDSGTFTLTNPVTSGVSGPVAFNAPGAAVQTAMQAVVGWEAVTVTGNPGGPWTINHGVVGVYSDPVSDTSGIVPANSAVNVTKTAVGSAATNAQWSVTQRAYRGRAVVIHWDYSGLDVTVNGVAIFTDLQTPGFVPAAGNKFGFSARCESSNTMDMFLDDVTLTTAQLQPVETGGPVISEFMADNAGTLADEDTDLPDWIELYNGQNATVNLSGWRLTNAPGNNAMWTFPSISMGPYAYKIVYASGKNRTVATGPLHTNFTLPKEGGYLALVKADGVTIATEFTYGAQYEDVSYGEKGPSRTPGYLQLSTPGAQVPYTAAQAAGGPAEDVVWSRAGGIITGSTPVAITAPVAAGAVVRYTTNHTEPGTASAVYNPASPPAAFTFNTTTTLRARIYAPGLLPGPVSSRTFLLLDSSLTNYNGSGQPFSSNLPIVVLDSFGVPVDSYTDGASRPYRLSYAVVIAPNPLTGRAVITDPPDFQGRCGTHVRGESSTGFPQRQYSWELWDNSNNDKNESILGMPAESDWILYAPWSEKTLMRDALVFGTMRKLRSDYLAARTQFCEVIFNQAAGTPVGFGSGYKGVYLIKEKLKIGKDRVDIAKLNSLTASSPNVTGGYIFRKDKADPDSTSWGTATFSLGLSSFDPDLLTAPQLTSLQGYVNSFESVLNGANFANPTTGYAAWMEADTFIDAQWFVEWTKQVDGYVFSTYFHKDRNGRLRGGPIWDFNIAIGNANYATGDSPTGWLYDSAGTTTGEGQLWYPRLHQDPWYRLRHFDRYWELRRGILASAAILGDIDAYAAKLLNGSATLVTNSMAALPPAQENAVMRQYRTYPRLGLYDWPNPNGFGSRTTYQSEVGYLKTWLTTRLNWIDDQNFVGAVVYRPPNFSQYGGNVNAGTQVTMTRYTGAAPAGFSYATGTIYYTTNGTDPRNPDGSPGGTAYSVPVTLSASQTVKARLYNAPRWSPVTTATFVVDAVPAGVANLVVSELMYNPLNATAAEITAGYSTNDFEYIELLNVSAGNVDLSNVAFTEGVLFNFGTNNPAILTVPPGGRVVVVGGQNAFIARYGNNAAVKIAGTFTGSFSNSGERITLAGATGAAIAQFTYGDSEPWPVDADGGVYNNGAPPQLIGGGYSLVLNNPAAGVNYHSGVNWRSSAQIGGTPGLVSGSAFAGQADGDTDGDGLKDFFEYATGSNLNNAASRSLPVVAIAPFALLIGTDNYLRLDFRRNLAADGVNFTAQRSADLATWAGDASAVTYVGTLNNGDGTATVTFRSTQPVSPGMPGCFMRLLVSP